MAFLRNTYIISKVMYLLRKYTCKRSTDSLFWEITWGYISYALNYGTEGVEHFVERKCIHAAYEMPSKSNSEAQV